MARDPAQPEAGRMTDGVYSRDEIVSFGRGSHSGNGPRKPVPQAALCALALVLSTAVGLTLLYTKDKAEPALPPVAVVPAPVAAPKPVIRQAASPAPMPAAIAPLRHYAAMFDPNLTLNAAVLFAQPAPLKKAYTPVRNAVPAAPDVVAALETQPAPTPQAPAKIAVEAPDVSEVVPAAPVVSEIEVPLPTPRPAALMAAHDEIPRAAAARRVAQATEPPPVAAPAPAPAAQPSFFDRMFGQVKNPGNVLAYAAPEDGAIGGFGLGTGGPGRPQAIDRYTAIYDISAHTVYLPDGTRLEAHSGVGPNKDDPRSVAARMRGVTPPNLYDLKEREAPFHGVRALRLNAVDGSIPYGRAGLLAHTYMLGPNGDSNGCVVFRDYRSFLAAYDSGAIRRLAVVARLN